MTPSSKEVGFSTLKNLSAAHGLNRWMFESIRPFVKGNILETGSGIGNISSLLLELFDEVSLSDLRKDYCDILQEKFGRNEHLKYICQLDLAEREIEKKFPEWQNEFDTILTSNVIEHIKDDHQAIRNCYKMLKQGGRIVILVPAYNQL